MSGPQTAHVLRTEEKGTDVNLASYLLLDAFREDCETAIVVSNDADLKTPIEIAKSKLDISVGVLNPHPLKRSSFDLQPPSSSSCAADRSPPASSRGS
ncbi:MAG: NYN domain-containing protein [Solirubrobacteraceae bacterium]